MEALIWGEVSSDGADHGPSCAAFASLTLELGRPDDRAAELGHWRGPPIPGRCRPGRTCECETNPASPQITAVAADAQAHGRWHPLGDGYLPQPGDWAVYDGHVAVVTSYSGGVLDTIAADSLPGLTVNAHSSAAPLADQGIAGFVDNGNLQPDNGRRVRPRRQGGAAVRQHGPGKRRAAPSTAKAAAAATAAVPGLPDAVALAGTGGIPGAGPAAGNGGTGEPAKAAVPGVLATGQLLGQRRREHRAAAQARPRPLRRT